MSSFYIVATHPLSLLYVAIIFSYFVSLCGIFDKCLQPVTTTKIKKIKHFGPSKKFLYDLHPGPRPPLICLVVLAFPECPMNGVLHFTVVAD